MAEQPSYPLYDIDEIFASLSISEQEYIENGTPIHKRKNTNSKSTTTSTGSAAPLTTETSAPTIYRYTQGQSRSYTADWAEAGNATQGIAHTSVQAVHREPKSPTSKRRGDEARHSTIGVPFSLHQGYATLAAAQRAFALAHANGWTRTTGSCAASSSPVHADAAPKPLPDSGQLIPTALTEASQTQKWYVVYAGINPGLFASNLECALNVLGVPGSLHESFTDLRRQRKEASATQPMEGDVDADVDEPPAGWVVWEDFILLPEFQQFHQYASLLLPRWLQCDPKNPAELAELQRILGGHPTTHNFELVSNETVLEYWRVRKHNWPEWAEELADYRDFLNEHSEAELKELERQARAREQTSSQQILPKGGF
ncbi:hypothetical protein C8J57DRAFT_1515530 [Mycena rebaudengoi]|nr:hypothetical protein C8J57DRAFT_1515530 [Mycena rebaudengoi]